MKLSESMTTSANAKVLPHCKRNMKWALTSSDLRKVMCDLLKAQYE